MVEIDKRVRRPDLRAKFLAESRDCRPASATPQAPTRAGLEDAALSHPSAARLREDPVRKFRSAVRKPPVLRPEQELTWQCLGKPLKPITIAHWRLFCAACKHLR